MSLKIVPLETRAKNITVPPLMDQIGLKHPFSLACYGMTGSGKTVAVLNLLTNPQMYGGDYFSEVYLFSATANSDDSFDALNLDKKHIITTDMISKLKKVLRKQVADVEKHGIDKAKKVCVILEDLTSQKKLMNSPEFLKIFVQNRHMNISVLACCHKYHALIRTARLNANHHLIFPCSESEVSRIVEEHQPAQLRRNEFEELIQYAFTPSEDNERPFLWVNLKVPAKIRFRKSLDQMLELS
jgi:hypothetical protein